MNHSRYLADSRRSPCPRRRKSLVPRSPGLGRSLPAITLLAPDGYHLQQTMAPRPLSPGGFRMAPPRSAKHKITSFVILNETISSPVTTRAPSPSGRVSPFRGHGFKSPTSSRPGSRAVSPLPSPARRKGITVPTDKTKVVHMDIGLPPKSPKRALKSVQIKEYKPPLKPKPVLASAKTGSQKPAGTVTPKVKVVNNKKPMVMSTVDKNKDKKPPAPPKNSSSTNSAESTTVSKSSENTDGSKMPEVDPEDPVTASKKEEPKKEVLTPCFQPDKCIVAPPTMASPSQTATSTTAVPSTSTSTSTSRAPASSLSAISSAVSVTESLSKRSLRPKPLERPITPRSPHLDDAKTKLALITAAAPAKVETAVATMTTVDEVIKNREGSAGSHKSLLSLASPTISEKTRSSMVTVRAASNGSLRSHGAGALASSGLSAMGAGDPGDVISTTKLIRADPDVEVLSPNNLLQSPPNAMREPLWQEDRIPNGSTPSSTAPAGRCRRFWTALGRLISYIFCCCKRWTCCRSGCCDRLNCCRKGTSPRPPEAPKAPSTPCCSKCRGCKCWNPCSFLKSCFSKLNCCKNLNCCSCCKSPSCCKKPFCGSCSKCCGKVKCCEGKKCCRRKTTSTPSASTMCCAKPSCSCKNCCTSMKNCCKSCGDGVNRCCRAFFCLNFLCCQKCLKKCGCCHKYKCCKKGGCCSCCNPHVKREQKTRLDKKNSRASNQSKQEKAKLDPALVEHASIMKAAIPVLPACLAWCCLFLNVGIPGSGTLLSGLLCLCFGKPRFSVNDTPQNRMSSFLVNLVMAVGQAFTIIFCLVGWGWSIWWGVIMVKLSRKQKRLKLAEKNQDAAAPSAVNQNHVDVERR